MGSRGHEFKVGKYFDPSIGCSCKGGWIGTREVLGDCHPTDLGDPGDDSWKGGWETRKISCSQPAANHQPAKLWQAATLWQAKQAR